MKASTLALTAIERKLICDTNNGLRNGVVFAATYQSDPAACEVVDDATTNMENNHNLTDSVVSGALSRVIEKHAELRTTVSASMQFVPLEFVRFDDVVNKIQFDCYKDEYFNCHDGIPPYILRHIFNNHEFTVGTERPLWQLYIVDESMVIFHGHDALFDSYAAANFHKLFLHELNSLGQARKEDSEFIFQHATGLAPLEKSIFARQSTSIFSTVLDPFNPGFPNAFKAFYNLAIKKPLHFIERGRHEHTPTPIGLPNGKAPMIPLCGKVVFGTVRPARLSVLRSYLDNVNYTLQVFVAAAAIFCLKAVNQESLMDFTFSIPMNLRDSAGKMPDLGLFHKNVYVDCPTSGSNNEIRKLFNLGSSNIEGATLHELAPINEVSDMEIQFEKVLSFVSAKMNNAAKRWRASKYGDDDLEWMKSEVLEPSDFPSTQVVEINDLTEHNFLKSENERYHIEDAYALRSRKTDAFMSITYCLSSSGLNLGIHYPDNPLMDAFVERLESFIELYPDGV
ncbi:LAME_0D11034g1_1 [Lachancea meyersii CBS 8951]|uniref:LAME_0D11034g1_1 n=1 Tax=Lachancea meyersii CBS 8951 TaxID=1266667 RepID=A0A1G4JC92_9SACH|nr:LAME_0D11034g1_1 [Lachancea meyersii CBS 8951]